MIKVRLFGMLRLDSGIKELSMDAKCVKEVLSSLEDASEKITKNTVNSCVVIINGTPGNKNSPLVDGDEVMLLSPAAGG